MDESPRPSDSEKQFLSDHSVSTDTSNSSNASSKRLGIMYTVEEEVSYAERGLPSP